MHPDPDLRSFVPGAMEQLCRGSVRAEGMVMGLAVVSVAAAFACIRYRDRRWLPFRLS